MGAAYATAFFVLLALLPLALGPSTHTVGTADPAAVRQQAAQLQQAFRETTDAKRQQQDVTQQLLQAQSAATSADAVSRSETARLGELLASRDAELERLRQQAQDAKAAAQQQVADFDRASADTIQMLHDAAKARSEEVERLQQQVDAERRNRDMAEGRAAAAEQSAAAKAAQQGGSRFSGSKDSPISLHPSAAGFMSPRWALQRLMAQVFSMTDCYSHNMRT